MSVKEKFVLKWADYSTTVTAALQELRNMEELFDITLAVENKYASSFVRCFMIHGEISGKSWLIN